MNLTFRLGIKSAYGPHSLKRVPTNYAEQNNKTLSTAVTLSNSTNENHMDTNAKFTETFLPFLNSVHLERYFFPKILN